MKTVNEVLLYDPDPDDQYGDHGHGLPVDLKELPAFIEKYKCSQKSEDYLRGYGHGENDMYDALKHCVQLDEGEVVAKLVECPACAFRKSASCGKCNGTGHVLVEVGK